MAISYPISTPSTIGVESITLRMANAVGTSISPFTYKEQIVTHQGQRWEVDVTVPSQRKEFIAEWTAFLAALKGRRGTFLLGDPDYTSGPRGTASSLTVTGSAGDESVTVSMSGTLLAGDYIQLGSGSSSRLHKVLLDRTNSGTMEIWPALRETVSSASASVSNTQGVFRLNSNMSEWSINNASAYGLSFSAVEVI